MKESLSGVPKVKIEESRVLGQLTVDTPTLMAMLDSGRKTAVDIGTAARARIEIGRRLLWNVKKIQEYLDSISE